MSEEVVPRSHEKEHFYKYMTCATAHAVLFNGSLRWSKPSLFNDPFDHQISFKFPFTQEEFSTELVSVLEQLVYRDQPHFQVSTLLSQMVEKLRQARDKIPKEEVLRTLIEGCKESASLFDDYQSNINLLLKASINTSRVLCVTENNDNVVMWSHYAASHTGVCLKLLCTDEIDNALLAARPVTYTDAFPVFMTLNDQISYLTGLSKDEVGKLIMNVAFMKHKDWSYENEWRIHRPHENSEGNYNDLKENPMVFSAIFFGCKIDQSDASSLMTIIEEEYPHMEIFQARPDDTGFKLNFKKLR